MSEMAEWVEYRCPKCYRTSVQMKDAKVWCWGHGPTRHPRRVMKQGFMGETQALMRSRLVGKEARV